MAVQATTVLCVAARQRAPGFDIDVSALMPARGRVRTDADLILCNQRRDEGVH